MRNKFLEHIEKNHFFQKDDKVLLALSGGVDSVVLFHLLLEADVDLHCAHVNYQLRGAASDEDAKFVFDLCGKHNIPIKVLPIDTKEYAKNEKLGIQEAARNIRYNWFEKLMTEWSCKWLLTGHHLDDSVETFFINLIRGTGLKGLTGIHDVRDNVLRPLLFASKGEILAFAQDEGISFRQDLTNFDNKYLRNSLRLNVIPRFLEFNAAFNKTMGANMNRIAKTQSFLDECVETYKKKYLEERAERIKLSKDILSEKSAALLLYEMLETYGFTQSQIDDLRDEPQVGKKFLGMGWKLMVERDHFFILKQNHDVVEDLEFVVDEDLLTDHLPLNLTFTVEKHQNNEISKNPKIVFLDADSLRFPLIVRKWRDGDKFQPFGMKGKKLISDFLTQLKTPSSERRDIWLLMSDNKIAWVVGKRVGHDYRTKESTQRILKIEFDDV